MKTFIRLWYYVAGFFLKWEMFHTKFVEKIKTQMLCSVTFFFSKNCAVCEVKWKDAVRVWDATDNNTIRRMRFARPITKATNTLRICYTYCFLTATMVAVLRYTYVRTLAVLFSVTSVCDLWGFQCACVCVCGRKTCLKRYVNAHD